MPRIAVHGTDRILDAPEGTSLLSAIQASAVPIATACGGQATCGQCRLWVRAGGQNLTPIVAVEMTHLGNVMKITGQRLACQARLCGDVTVEIPPVEAKEDRMRRKKNNFGRRRR